MPAAPSHPHPACRRRRSPARRRSATRPRRRAGHGRGRRCRPAGWRATSAAANGPPPACRSGRTDPGTMSTPVSSMLRGCVLAGRPTAPKARSQRDVSGVADDTPKPVGAGQIGEGDLGCRVVGWAVDRPGQHRAADLQHRGQRRRRGIGSGNPQTGIRDESHPATCNSSIDLIRWRWSRLTDLATPSSRARTSSTSSQGSCQTSRPCSRAHSRLR